MIYIMILRRMLICWGKKKRPKGRYWTWSESSQGLSMAKGLLMAVRKKTKGGGCSLWDYAKYSFSCSSRNLQST